jgi:NAD(P)-dependent dehydrogenase (short-subunit alcohol dehydrogenase family)
MQRLLEDKAAIVTGGSQGLGLAIATTLAMDGASVLIAARTEEKVQRAVAQIESRGGVARGLVADVTAPGAAARIVQAALAAFGRLDILVNNAGAFVWKRFFDLTADDWQRTIATNLTGPFFLMQEAARVLADQKRGGSIINITSIHGSVGDPNVAAHCASKFGLEGITRSAAEALREHDIRVNAVAPGSIEPDSAEKRGESPRKKVTQADVATLVSYLASDLARSITGATIEAHGSTRMAIKA